MVDNASTAQTLFVARHDEDSYVPGRRAFLRFRDLGTEAATSGALGLTAIEAKEGMQQATDWHYHATDHNTFYFIGGWAKMEFVEPDGSIRTIRFEAGDAYTLRGGTVHRELATSDDLEALEIAVPAQFETISVDPPANAAA